MIRKTLALAAILSMAGASQLAAFGFLGGKWAARDVPYYINLTDCPGDKPSLVTDFQNAAASWELQSHANIHLVYMGQTTKSGLVNDRTNVISCQTGSSSAGYIGQSSGGWFRDASGNYTDADIVIWLGTYPQYPFIARNVPCTANLYYTNILVHEFGHILGLDHSTVAGATMVQGTSVCSTNEESLEPDDIQGIETLYPASPSPSPAPSPDPPPTPVPPPVSCELAPFSEVVQNRAVSAEVARLQGLHYFVSTTNLKKGYTRIDAVCP